MEKTKTTADLRRRFGDGRQYGTKLEEIKDNHKKRYVWAAERLHGLKVVDAGCGIGYGSWLLGERCFEVVGLEFNSGVVESAREIWARPHVSFQQFDLQSEARHSSPFPSATGVVAFEIIEHLLQPEFLFSQINLDSILLGSVPNEEFFPHRIYSNPFHMRHYTYSAMEAKLSSCGFEVMEWFHQGLRGDIKPGKKKNKTLLFGAVRREKICPTLMVSDYSKDLLRQLLLRANLINDLKNGTEPKPLSAY